MSTRCRIAAPNTPWLLTQLVGLELLQKLRKLSRVLGFRRPVALTPDVLRPPDSALADKVRRFVERVSSPMLANHCHRSFVFAVAIAHNRRYRFDRELLYLAIMMHDLGLTDEFLGPDPFETRGAMAAQKFCRDNRMSDEDTRLVFDAIELHTSIRTAFREPPMSLVQLGAGVDVLGYCIEDVAKETVDYAVQTHPRFGMKDGIVELLSREAKQNPAMISAAHMRFGFASRIRQAPFAE